MYTYVYSLLNAAITGFKRPELRDVYRYVIQKYAHKWRYLGAELHFDQAELEIIFSNSPNSVEECCRVLVTRWLDRDSNASWDHLLTAIDNLHHQSTVPELTSEYQSYIAMVYVWLLVLG